VPLLAECEPAKCSDPDYKCIVYGPPTSNASEARRRKLYAEKTDCNDFTDAAVRWAAETSGLQAASCSELLAEGACKMDLVYSKMCPVACGACGRAAAMTRRGRRLGVKENVNALAAAAVASVAVCQGDRTLLEASRQYCETVTGNLRDDWDWPPEVRDVNLPLLREVRGNIYVRYNDKLTSLTMNSLEHVRGGDNSLTGNKNLATLSMNSLETVGGNLYVTDNDNLATLTMNNLKDVLRDIRVTDNPSLVLLTMTSLRSVNYIAVRASPTLCPSALPLPSRTFPRTVGMQR